MNDDEVTIRDLIERWATAAHDGDLETVLAHHDAEIVMYDVPPPEDGRGLAAYRETWPGFFRWQDGATFDLLSLDVVAGADVAFAYGLLRCGTPEEELDGIPERRLRLTVGLRKVDGQWTVLHEHHSFTARD